MKSKTFILLVFISFLIHTGQAARNNKRTDTLYAAELKPFGRYIVNERNELELISSAVHFGFKFQGTQCALYISNKDKSEHNYIQYELDGIYQKRLRIDGNPLQPTIISATGKGVHTIWVYKATEALTGAIVVTKITGRHIKSISVSNSPLVEFIGNSITCGAASDTSDFACNAGEYHDHTNAYMAYGPRVAKALGANYILSSVSGIGIYRTWNADGPSMPQVYENTELGVNASMKWDFNKYHPKIVGIALGTNDMSNGDGKTARSLFDEQVFVNSFVNFIKLVKSKYPAARIVLLSSPMIKGNSREVLEKCLITIKNQVDSIYPSDKKVETFLFTPMDAHGCSGHPSIADHLILSEELKPFFQKLLNE
jgi:lysophospholipase L1-like esterase